MTLYHLAPGNREAKEKKKEYIGCQVVHKEAVSTLLESEAMKKKYRPLSVLFFYQFNHIAEYISDTASHTRNRGITRKE